MRPKTPSGAGKSITNPEARLGAMQAELVQTRSHARDLAAERDALLTELTALRAFVRSVAVVEAITTIDGRETCTYCGCSADEADGPITCHAAGCLQLAARKLVATYKVKEA